MITWTSSTREKNSKIIAYLLVEFNPSKVTFRICVLQAKEPDFPQTNRFDDLVEELFACGALLDSEFQLRIHCRNSYI